MEWSEQQVDLGELHPLILLATFVYEFLRIHPFQDGNGRLAHLLPTPLLLENGCEFVQYASLEPEVVQCKADYQQSLLVTRRFRGTKNELMGSWLMFLLKATERVVAEPPRAALIGASRVGCATSSITPNCR